MINLRDQLENDIKLFFDQIEKQTKNDQVKTLLNLFDKYLHLNKSDHMMDYSDIHEIINNAKSLFASKNFPIFLGQDKRKVPNSEQANVCLIECAITYLNKQECLKRIPKLDYREDKF